MQQQEFIRKRKIKRILSGCLLLTAFICSAVIWFTGTWSKVYEFCGLGEPLITDSPFSIRVFSVGAADCILIQCRDKSVLVDTGTEETGSAAAKRLKRQGIAKLDYVILTHPHEDHIGGFWSIAEKIPVQSVLVPPSMLSVFEGRKQWQQQWDQQGIAYAAVSSSQRISLGEDCAMEFLSAGLSNPKDENDHSLVFRIRYRNCTALFMGDATVKTEQELLSSGDPLQADWIKIGHHGSKGSSSEEFLKAVSPQYAMISCGAAVPPSEELLLRLDTVGAVIYRTDLDGTVLFESDGVRLHAIIQDQETK